MKLLIFMMFGFSSFGSDINCGAGWDLKGSLCFWRELFGVAVFW
jgi:hypothetical protein